MLSRELPYNPTEQTGICDHLGRWQMGLVTNPLILSVLHFHKCQHVWNLEGKEKLEHKKIWCRGGSCELNKNTHSLVLDAGISMPQCNINEIQQHHGVFAVSSLGMCCVRIEHGSEDKVTYCEGIFYLSESKGVEFMRACRTLAKVLNTETRWQM